FFRQRPQLFVVGETVRVWDFSSGAAGLIERCASRLYSVAIASDDGWWAWADDRGFVEIHDGSGRYYGRIPTGQDRIWCATFAPDGRTLATASRDGTVKIWDHITRDTDRQATLMAPATAWVHSTAFSPEGRIVSAQWSPDRGCEERVGTWDPLAGKFRTTRLFPLPVRIDRAELSQDGTTLALLGSDRSCQVWDLKTERGI